MGEEIPVGMYTEEFGLEVWEPLSNDESLT